MGLHRWSELASSFYVRALPSPAEVTSKLRSSAQLIQFLEPILIPRLRI